MRDGENNGLLAGVPLLPPPFHEVSHPNSLPLPFQTPATQAKRGENVLVPQHSHTLDQGTPLHQSLQIILKRQNGFSLQAPLAL